MKLLAFLDELRASRSLEFWAHVQSGFCTISNEHFRSDSQFG
jgi:hypothetical protein